MAIAMMAWSLFGSMTLVAIGLTWLFMRAAVGIFPQFLIVYIGALGLMVPLGIGSFIILHWAGTPLAEIEKWSQPTVWAALVCPAIGILLAIPRKSTRSRDAGGARRQARLSAALRKMTTLLRPASESTDQPSNDVPRGSYEDRDGRYFTVVTLPRADTGEFVTMEFHFDVWVTLPPVRRAIEDMLTFRKMQHWWPWSLLEGPEAVEGIPSGRVEYRGGERWVVLTALTIGDGKPATVELRYEQWSDLLPVLVAVAAEIYAREELGDWRQPKRSDIT
jgi:hypothetical protein